MIPMKCRVLQAQRILGKKWTMFIMEELRRDSAQSFNTLKGNLMGVTNKTLSQRLKELEFQGIVTRTIRRQKPLQVHYALSEKGQELKNITKLMKRWGERYNTVSSSCQQTNCTSCSWSR